MHGSENVQYVALCHCDLYCLLSYLSGTVWG